MKKRPQTWAGSHACRHIYRYGMCAAGVNGFGEEGKTSTSSSRADGQETKGKDGQDVRIDMYIDMYTGLRIGMRIYGHIYGHLYRYVYGHMHGHVYRHLVYGHACRHVHRHVCRHACWHCEQGKSGWWLQEEGKGCKEGSWYSQERKKVVLNGKHLPLDWQCKWFVSSCKSLLSKTITRKKERKKCRI